MFKLQRRGQHKTNRGTECSQRSWVVSGVQDVIFYCWNWMFAGYSKLKAGSIQLRFLQFLHTLSVFREVSFHEVSQLKWINAILSLCSIKQHVLGYMGEWRHSELDKDESSALPTAKELPVLIRQKAGWSPYSVLTHCWWENSIYLFVHYFYNSIYNVYCTTPNARMISEQCVGKGTLGINHWGYIPTFSGRELRNPWKASVRAVYTDCNEKPPDTDRNSTAWAKFLDEKKIYSCFYSEWNSTLHLYLLKCVVQVLLILSL